MLSGAKNPALVLQRIWGSSLRFSFLRMTETKGFGTPAVRNPALRSSTQFAAELTSDRSANTLCVALRYLYWGLILRFVDDFAFGALVEDVIVELG